MNRQDYRISEDHGFPYQGTEGSWAYVTDREDPRLNLAGEIVAVTPYNIIVSHFCEDGSVSKVTLGNHLGLVIGESDEVSIRDKVTQRNLEINKAREDIKTRNSRKQRAIKRAKSRII